MAKRRREKARRTRDIEGRPLTPAGKPLSGRSRLLLIAVGAYRDWPSLPGPAKDVSEVRRALLERYACDDGCVEEITDEAATRKGIMTAFERLKEEAGPEDSVLIWYAGHGHTDPGTGVGFWIPHDGGRDRLERERWIANQEVRGYLRAFECAHVLLVSDSCFSGDLLDPQRTADVVVDRDWCARAHGLRSREVLTSGASEPVSDSSLGGMSPFAFHFVDTLRRNADPYLTPVTIFDHVSRGVTGQMPLLGALEGAGHQRGGSYLFFLRSPEVVKGARAPETSPVAGAAAEPRQRPRPAAVGVLGWPPKKKGAVLAALVSLAALTSGLAIAGIWAWWRAGRPDPGLPAADGEPSAVTGVPEPGVPGMSSRKTAAEQATERRRGETEEKVSSILKMARSFHEAGLPDKARDEALEALRVVPNHAEAKRFLAEVQAELAARQSEAERATEYRKWMDEGLRLRLAGRLREAAGAYERAKALATEADAKAVAAIGESLAGDFKAKAMEAEAAGDLGLAVELYAQAVAMRDAADLRRALAEARKRLDDKQAQDARRTEAERWRSRGTDAERRGDLNAALGYYREAASHGADLSSKISLLERECAAREEAVRRKIEEERKATEVEAEALRVRREAGQRRERQAAFDEDMAGYGRTLSSAQSRAARQEAWNAVLLKWGVPAGAAPMGDAKALAEKVGLVCWKCGGAGRSSCDTCSGSGRLACPACGGKGVVWSWVRTHRESAKCERCGGADAAQCKVCGGRGVATCTECRGSGRSKTCAQ